MIIRSEPLQKTSKKHIFWFSIISLSQWSTIFMFECFWWREKQKNIISQNAYFWKFIQAQSFLYTFHEKMRIIWNIWKQESSFVVRNPNIQNWFRIIKYWWFLLRSMLYFIVILILYVLRLYYAEFFSSNNVKSLVETNRCVNNSPNRKINDSWGIEMFPN